jgi:hypothetical protein
MPSRESSIICSDADLPVSLATGGVPGRSTLIIRARRAGPLAALLLGIVAAAPFGTQAESPAPRAPEEGAFTFSLSFEIESLSGGEAVGAGPGLPVSIGGTVAADEEAGITISSLELSIDGSRTSGSARIQPGIDSRINITLVSELIDISNFIKQNKNQRTRLFADQPLPLDLLHGWHGDLHLSADELRAGTLVVEDLVLPARLESGSLQLTDVRARIAGGRMTAHARLDAGEHDAILSARMAVRGLEPERLPHLPERPWVNGGRTDIDLVLDGRGPSLAGILATADGTLLLQVGSGSVPDSEIGLPGFDFLWTLFTTLNPVPALLPGGGDQVLECAILDFTIDAGTARTDRGIAVRTGRMTVIGSGTVDLRSESIDLALEAQSRDGGSGLSLPGFAGTAKIGGTLLEPEYRINPLAPLSSGIAAGTAAATGGLGSIARKLLDPGAADVDPCRAAVAAGD